MHKKTLLILTASIIILIAISLLISNSPKNPQKYYVNISRNINNPEVETAIRTAETINYSSIISKERFIGSTDPESYLHPGTYLTYTQANFIDSEVISYYTTRYNNLQGKGNPGQIELTYEANVTKRSEFRIFNSPAPEGVTWHNATIFISAPDGSLMRKDATYMQFFYRNQSEYLMTEWGYDFNFSNCQVVEMKLMYSEIYAPLAALFMDIEQIVVLDQNFTPVLIGVTSGMAVA